MLTLLYILLCDLLACRTRLFVRLISMALNMIMILPGKKKNRVNMTRIIKQWLFLSAVQAKALVLLVVLSVCSICPTAVDAGRCDPQPDLIFSSNCYPSGLCAGGVCCDCPSGVALYESPRFTCKADTSISGTADVRLSNGKTEDTGFSASKCDSECTSKSACQSFVWKESDGYEL